MRLVLLVLPLVIEQAAFLQVSFNLWISVLDEFSRKGVIADDDALQVDMLDKPKFLLSAQHQILVAESGSDGDNPSALPHAHQIGGHHTRRVGVGVHQLSRSVALHAPAYGDPVLVGIVERTVRHADQFAAEDLPDDRVFPLQNVEQSSGEHQLKVARHHDGVFGDGIHRKGGVAGQRPGSSGPGQEIGRRSLRPSSGLKPDENRWATGIFPVAPLPLRG